MGRARRRALRILGALVLVGLTIIAAGCGGGNDGQSLDQVPSFENVVSSPEVNLLYPGATPSCRIGFGSAEGKDGFSPAFVTRIFSVDSKWRTLFLWYHLQLVERGWHWVGYGRSTEGAQVLVDHYVRGDEQYVVATMNVKKLARESSCAARGKGKLVFEASLTATSPVRVHNAPVPIRLPKHR